MINSLTISSVMLLPVFIQSIPIQFGIMTGSLAHLRTSHRGGSMPCGTDIQPYNITFICINVSKGQYHDSVLRSYELTFSCQYEHCCNAV